MSFKNTEVPAHNVFTFGDVTFSSNFDNGNLARAEQTPNKSFDYKIWTAPDNMGMPHQSKHCAWFYFMVTGLPQGCVLRIQIVNTSNHSGLYKYDMRPVYRSNATNQRWLRIKSSVRFSKDSNNAAQLFFEHGVETANDKLFFAFTYPYTYTMVQNELAQYDSAHVNTLDKSGSIFYQRELLTQSLDGRRIDLLTISSVDGISSTEKEPLLSGLFPETRRVDERVPVFPEKEIVFVSARVHSGEVPAQHTFKGILSLLMDPNDLRAKELRARYVFKLIPMLNPDGVYRGHFRMDQLGQNLNRYYLDPDPSLQPAIYAAKALTDYFSQIGKLSVYLDFHAHASKRGCFIYGNVLDSAEDQIQNQLYCKLIALNSAHFDYEGCLFSKDHMTRIDPGDQAKGLTAEGSGRVSMYLAHKMIHSYTIECNYNTSRVGNEIAPPDCDPCGEAVNPASSFTTNPEKYTPSVFAGVGRACVIALLDIRGHNPCSRLSKSKFKTLDRVRNAVMMEVRSRKEYIGKSVTRDSRRRPVMQADRRAGDNTPTFEDLCWRRVVESAEAASAAPSAPSTSQSARGAPSSSNSNGTSAGSDRSNEIFFIPMKEAPKRRRPSSGIPTGTSAGANSAQSVSSSNAGRMTPQPTAPPGNKPENGRTITPRSVGLAAANVPPRPALSSASVRVAAHVGDNTCIPTQALAPHLARRHTEGIKPPGQDNGLLSSSPSLSRDSSQSRASPSLASFEFLSQPDSRSSTPSIPNGSSLGQVNLGIAGSSSSLLIKDAHLHNNAPMPYLFNKKTSGNMSSAQSTGVGSIGSGGSPGTTARKSGHNNILGKKLSAAGVALVMGANASTGSLDGALNSSRKNSTSGGEIGGYEAHRGNMHALPASAHSVGDALDSLAGLLPHRAHADVSHLSPRATSADAFVASPVHSKSRSEFFKSDDFEQLTLDEARRDNYSISSEHTPRLDRRSAELAHLSHTSPIKSIRSPKQSPN